MDNSSQKQLHTTAQSKKLQHLSSTKQYKSQQHRSPSPGDALKPQSSSSSHFPILPLMKAQNSTSLSRNIYSNSGKNVPSLPILRTDPSSAQITQSHSSRLTPSSSRPLSSPRRYSPSASSPQILAPSSYIHVYTSQTNHRPSSPKTHLQHSNSSN